MGLRQECFCQDWRFAKGDHPEAPERAFDDSSWEKVVIPHTWNADDMAPGMPTEKAYVGPAWYRKRFQARKPEGDGRLFLLFEAVANFSEVYVNGAYAGGRDGGFLSFRVDVTDMLDDSGEQVVCVKADNSFRWGFPPPELIDWERYGGMYRPVWLIEKGGALFEHKTIRVETPAVSKANARVTVCCRVSECSVRARPLTVRHRVLDSEGAKVCRAEESIESRFGRTVESFIELPKIKRPRLWSPDAPNLYSVESVLLDGDTELDRETNPLGFRWFEFHPDKGFSLNGKAMKLLGVDIHQEYPGLGFATPARFHRMDMELVKGAGLNFIRGSHYPRNERVLDACDRLGIMVMEEQPFWHGSLRVAHGEGFVNTARRLMRDMVEQHGNHPCIIAWNTVNEILLLPQLRFAHPDPAQRGKNNELPREEWPFARRVLAAMNDELHRADPSRPTCMVVGGWWRQNEEAGMTRLADMVAYNGGAVNSLVEGHPPYDVCKEKDPARISLMSEGVLNAGPQIKRADWEGEKARWETCARHWTRFYERDWFCGGAMWVFADYSAKGAYRNMAMVDFSRLPYEEYFFFQSQWTEEPMAHILNHWDWPGQEGQEQRVVVFTNCVTAELFLNSQSLGAGKPNRAAWPLLPHPPMEWNVRYAPGELRVVARKGKMETVDIRHTSGVASAIELQCDQDHITPDGQDVAFVRVATVDAAGRRCYNAFPTIEIEAAGAACLCGPKRLEARGGVARFAIRSNGQTGEARVTVNGEGLKAGAISIPVR